MPQISAPLATLLMGLVAGGLLLYVHRLNSYRAASVKFREAVLKAFEGLYPLPSKWPDNIDAHLRNAFPPLQRSVAEFRSFVPWHRRRAFDAAWFRYRCATGREIDTQCYHHYIAFSDQPDPKQTCRENVNVLLSFAKQP
jgi:hypothetical protein